MLAKCVKSLENWLSDKSEIVYIFPAIPCFINFFLVLVSASIYIAKKTEYQQCEIQNRSDMVQIYLFGQIILLYIFLAFYSNILLEYIPYLRGLIWNFIFLFFWVVGSLVWNIIGVKFIQAGQCQLTSYHPISLANIIIFFIQFGSCISYIIFLIAIKLRDNYRGIQQVNPTQQEVGERPKQGNQDDQNSKINDSIQKVNQAEEQVEEIAF